MARPNIQKQNRAIIVEGYFDVVTLHQAGFKEAIATCGTALTVEHLETLRPLTTKVISVFDSDEAGLRAAEKSYPLFLDAAIESFQLELQGAKDPDEFINSFGPEKFADNLGQARTLFELKLDLLIQRHGLTPGSKQKITEELAPYLRKMPIVSRDACVSQVARQLGVLEASIRSYVGRGKQNKQKSTNQNSSSHLSILVRDLIWLLIHFPSFVRPLLEALEPTSISTNNDLLFVMGLFMEGHSVTEVIENVSNENIRSMLLQLSVLDDLYVEEDISKAVPQIIDRIRLSNLKKLLLVQQRELSQRSPDTDMMSYLVSLKQLQKTRREMEVLQQNVRDLSVRS